MASDPTWYTFMNSPFGDLLLARNSAGLFCASFQEGSNPKTPEAGWRLNPAALAEAVFQLQAYFDGELCQFSLSLAPQGLPFQRQVWRAAEMIPYGETVTSHELACRFLCQPHLPLAVETACRQNPLAILIPVHRVVGSHVAPAGHPGGERFHQALLSLERQVRSRLNLQQMFTEFQTNTL